MMVFSKKVLSGIEQVRVGGYIIRKTTISGKQQFYLVSVIADKLIYSINITRTNFRSDIVGDLE